jgi:ABC-type microcin C transport system permease subunit YejB
MKEPKLQFNREELFIIRQTISECYLEHDLMSAEIGLIRAKDDNASENEISLWKAQINNIKKQRKVNKNLIKKINKYFGFDNE